MAIEFNCPTCGKQLRAREDTGGRQGSCPHCRNRVRVPEAVYEAEEVSGTEDLGQPAAYALAPEAVPNPPEDRRPCPVCGELIMRTAVKCRFCGEVFDPTLRRARRSRSRSDSYDDDHLSGLDWAICVLCSSIACVVGIVYMLQGKSKGAKMFAIAFVIQSVIGVVVSIMTAALEQP